MREASLSHNNKLSDLLRQIEESDHVVVYCGAGITQDRTGVSWTDLTKRVAAQAKFKILEEYKISSEDEASVRSISTTLSDFFNDRNLSAEIKASVACALTLDDQHSITSALKDALYRDSGWKHGRLLAALVDFVTLVAFRGKKVSVVTTNYDVYLQEALVANLEAIAARVSLKPREGRGVPGLDVIAFEAENEVWKKDTLVPAYGSASIIELTYVHGRVDRGGDLRGTLVFSEKDYEKSHPHTIKLLCGLFRTGPTIIVGCGLTDTPLIRSLLQIKRDKTVQYKRYVAIRGRITDDKCSNIIQRARSTELAIEPLFYEHYDDVPNLFINLYALTVQNLVEYEGMLPCEFVIKQWVDRSEFTRSISKYGYDLAANFVRDTLLQYANREELLKVECWFLDTEKSDSVLRIWANSAGPIYTMGLRRTEKVLGERKSKVAAVRAFSSGQPTLTNLDELGFGDTSANRWKSFLAVPIPLSFREYQIDVIVGVVTLASTYEISSFADVDFFDLASPLRKEKVRQTESFLSIASDNLRVDFVNSLKTLGVTIAELIYRSKVRSIRKSQDILHIRMRRLSHLISSSTSTPICSAMRSRLRRVRLRSPRSSPPM